ncbi:MAG TPA: succinate dehydrogenase, cytochrome b556 subunit [Aestuariivirgaceae bacterium]|nr:succinate dehydrogenase, cytochrome b556 subunit [Aestuariivirgaceae bacterium]
MTMPKDIRPLSPHLQIYRPMLTMMMSIVHRLTGVALYFGTLILVWWLISAARGPDAFATAQSLLATPFGILVLVGYSWALIHHMLGGLRHLLWDTGRGLTLPSVERLAQLNLAGSIALTVLLWSTVIWTRGAP